jgi:hypothetical protein
MNSAALDVGQVKNLTIGGLVAIALLGALLCLLISALVGRLVIVLLVSFLGYHVSFSAAQVKACKQLSQ